MSLSELKSAVEELSPEEFMELAAFVRSREDEAWDLQIDADFGPKGRLSNVLEEVRADIKNGRLGELP